MEQFHTFFLRCCFVRIYFTAVLIILRLFVEREELDKKAAHISAVLLRRLCGSSRADHTCFVLVRGLVTYMSAVLLCRFHGISRAVHMCFVLVRGLVTHMSAVLLCRLCGSSRADHMCFVIISYGCGGSSPQRYGNGGRLCSRHQAAVPLFHSPACHNKRPLSPGN